MSAANGLSTPPSARLSPSAAAASPVIAKRKRLTAQANALSQRDQLPHTPAHAAHNAHSFEALQADVLAFLEIYDTNPSILHQPIRRNADRAASGEPNSKRTKLAQPSAPDATIAAKLQSGAYASLEEVVQDVESASSQLSTSVHAQHASSEAALADAKLTAGILAFKKVLKNIIIRESQRKAALAKADEQSEDAADGDEATTNGVVKEEPAVEEGDGFGGSRAVLTLFASAQGNKQLFSSLQKPVKVEAGQDETEPLELDTSVDVTLPLDESGLPSMISTTKIIPVHTEDAIGGKSKGPTFGELFGPPPKFRELKAPIPASQSTTKGSTVTWGQQDPALRSSRRGSTYASQKLSTGDWLGYSGVDLPKEPSSPSAKRKQRDRALSTGEVNPPPSEEEQAKVEKAKADALFRSIYSSFAPTHDDGMAVIPEETKNRVWWQRVGEKRFNETFAIDPALFDAQPGESLDDTVMADASTEEEAFKEAIEEFKPEELSIPEKSAQDKEDREVDEILKDISELLETLHSYQRIRHTTLAPAARTPAVQDNSVRPTTPSSDEVDVYDMLKTQLALMISTLPPYAVAKLNGDQLADLNISRNLVIETKDYRGVMEEDQVSKLAKAAAIGAVVGSPAVQVRSTASAHHYAPSAGQYARTPSAPQYPSTRPVAGAQAYYPQQQPPNRSPSIHQYPPRTTQPYQTPGAYASTAQRPSYNAPPYAQQTSRPSSYGATASAYGQTPHSYYGQRPPATAYGMGHSYYQSTPQGPSQARYTQPGSAYPPRTQSAAPMYNYTGSGSPQVRTGSPLKQPQPPTQTPYAPPQRPPSANPYGTPSQQQPQRPSYYQQTPGGPYSATPPVQPSTPLGANSSYHASIQAHAQATARLAAQAQMARASSGTPPQPHGAQTPGQGQSQGNNTTPAAAVAS